MVLVGGAGVEVCRHRREGQKHEEREAEERGVVPGLGARGGAVRRWRGRRGRVSRVSASRRASPPARALASTALRSGRLGGPAAAPSCDAVVIRAPAPVRRSGLSFRSARVYSLRVSNANSQKAGRDPNR